MQILVIKLGDKKQYLNLIIISGILLLLITEYQTQRRELRVSVGNKDAGSGSKDGSRISQADNPRKIQKCLKTKAGLAMNQLQQQRGWNQQRWSRRRQTWREWRLGGGGRAVTLCHSTWADVPLQQGKVGLHLGAQVSAPGAAEISLRQPWYC